MTRGSKIPLEVHYIIIRLSSVIKSDDIAIYTGVSPRTVNRILRYSAMHGSVEGEKERKIRGGILRDTDLRTAESVITKAVNSHAQAFLRKPRPDGLPLAFQDAHAHH